MRRRLTIALNIAALLSVFYVADEAIAATTVNGACVYRASALSLTSGSTTEITFDSEVWDNGGYHDISTNTERLTAPAAGTYLATLNVEFASNATGRRDVLFFINGPSGAIPGRNTANAVSTSAHRVTISAVVNFAAGDWLSAAVMQNSGGALNVTGGSAQRFCLSELGQDGTGGGGSSTLAGLTDVDVTGVVNGAVLKYDSGLGKWIDGSDLDSGGAGGAVALSDDDRERLDLIWWGVWGTVGFLAVLLFAQKWHVAWRFMRE